MWKGRKEDSIRLSLVFIIAHVIYFSINPVLAVPRPWLIYPDIVPAIHVYGYSFPSGHTSLTVAFFGMMSLIYRKKSVLAISIIMIVMVTFSRMFLGAHTPTDIIGGIVVGLSSIAITEWCWNHYETKRKELCLVIVGISLLLFAIYIILYFVSNSVVISTLVYLASMTAMPAISLLAYRITRNTDYSFKLPDKAVFFIVGAVALIMGLDYDLIFNISANGFDRYIVIATVALSLVYPLVVNRIIAITNERKHDI